MKGFYSAVHVQESKAMWSMWHEKNGDKAGYPGASQMI